jgi:hypothetical protein
MRRPNRAPAPPAQCPISTITSEMTGRGAIAGPGSGPLGVRVRLGYDTWGVKPGDKLYLKPEDRAHIW